MAYIKCPNCDEKIRIYGDDDSIKNIEKQGVKVLAELPIDPLLAKMVDRGQIEEYDCPALNKLLDTLEK